MQAVEFLTPGSVVHHRYRIVQQIARGGMGAVYEAVDSRLKCTVALKQMLALPETNRALDDAFEREAQLLAGLRHPALPVVTDYFSEAGQQFLLMQFIPGQDLAVALQRRGAGFSFDEIHAWLERLFDALEYLHAHAPPIIHRDIKPGNLKLTDTGELVLLDFGLAKGSAGDPAFAATQASVAGYTLRYAPLEQIEGRGTDARSDLYAVGATIYHLLAGIPPPSAMERATAVVSRQPDPLRAPHDVRRDVPQSVSDSVTKAMALNRDDRFGSARLMRAALFQTPQAVASGVEAPVRQDRRIDAVAPSRVQLGTPIDLFVQVRFLSSPLLGAEEWPERRRPAEVEQVSDNVGVVFPKDPETGRVLPARLRVRVVAPDFRIAGRPHQLIEVPPDAYSKRIAFLLSAIKPGPCRINVEVYREDRVYLGAVPVHMDVRGEPTLPGGPVIANLLLRVLAERMPGLFAAVSDDADEAARRAAKSPAMANAPTTPEPTPSTSATAPGTTVPQPSVPPLPPGGGGGDIAEHTVLLSDLQHPTIPRAFLLRTHLPIEGATSFDGARMSYALGNKIVLDRVHYLMGRLPSSDLRLYSETASREHAQLTMRDGCWYLTPVPGAVVYVNGVSVKEEILLIHGTRLQLGHDTFLFSEFRTGPSKRWLVLLIAALSLATILWLWSTR